MLLVLVAGFLGLSTQLQAGTACVIVDGGAPTCTEMPVFETDPWLDGDFLDLPPWFGGGETGFGGGGGLGSAVKIGKILISADNWIKGAQAAGHLGELTVDWGKKILIDFEALGACTFPTPREV